MVLSGSGNPAFRGNRWIVSLFSIILRRPLSRSQLDPENPFKATAFLIKRH